MLLRPKHASTDYPIRMFLCIFTTTRPISDIPTSQLPQTPICNHKGSAGLGLAVAYIPFPSDYIPSSGASSRTQFAEAAYQSAEVASQAHRCILYISLISASKEETYQWQEVSKHHTCLNPGVADLLVFRNHSSS